MYIKLMVFLFFALTSCSTYYSGQFSLFVDKNDSLTKNQVLQTIRQVGRNHELLPVYKASNDTLTFTGPPYHYVHFIFDNKSKQDSLLIQLIYDGILSTQSSTDRIYFNMLRDIDSIYKGRITYKQLEKR